MNGSRLRHEWTVMNGSKLACGSMLTCSVRPVRTGRGRKPAAARGRKVMNACKAPTSPLGMQRGRLATRQACNWSNWPAGRPTPAGGSHATRQARHATGGMQRGERPVGMQRGRRPAELSGQLARLQQYSARAAITILHSAAVRCWRPRPRGGQHAGGCIHLTLGASSRTAAAVSRLTLKHHACRMCTLRRPSARRALRQQGQARRAMSCT